MSKTSIFLTGATGYIGGAVLARLLEHPSADTFEITVLTRSAEKAKKLEAFGVKPVVGTYAQLDRLEALAEQSHVVFSCAESDNKPAIEAILRGLRKRHATIGDLPILVHTSGTGVISQPTKGLSVTETIYSDLNVEQIKSIPSTAIHRTIDLAVVEADEQGYAHTHIVLPSLVYGVATNALVKAGIANPISIQIPDLVRASVSRRQGGMIGEGKSRWPNVHIDDLADLYIKLFDAITRDPEGTGHGWAGFYFGENGEHSWYEISKAISVALVELGVSKSEEPTPFTKEELIKYWGDEDVGLYSGSTSRCRADRARAIGWKPEYTTADMVKSIKPEVEAIWKQTQEQGEIKLKIPQMIAEMQI
ncbi:NAD(P)-binding protein [Wolfiporia cocos MD-104 SS10]|uniref:NAD(P)-binding protein n=1 Tax=Wolfiporia cocos (strain MD-104) TaxID=742152 RepID=A0A2H3JLX8_WOLCO|nr:NAD(P)-binding protein [Wolfiporia cocos MD-104 SS10]